MAGTATVEVEGRELKLSNLDKVLYPQSGFTKGGVIDYYTRIAPVLLPHLRDRPLTLKRYPNGVEGQFFYEKNCPKYRPGWMRTIPIRSDRQDKTIEFCCIEDLAGLTWVANLANLELHAALNTGSRLGNPTACAFDLDPGPETSIVECCEVALILREIFGKVRSYPKTSGSKGMQVYIPLNGDAGFEAAKAFAHGLALRLEKQMPDLVVSEMKKSLRTGKVFIDWSQNDFFKTTVCVYSLRAKEVPTVSTPLRWEEVESCLRSKDPEELRFTSDQVLARVEEHGDRFAPVLSEKQSLPEL